MAILQLAAEADSRATRRDAAGYAALFTEDGVMEGDMGHASGRDALAAAVTRVWDDEPPGTLHLTCNAVVDDSASTPVVASILVMLIPNLRASRSKRPTWSSTSLARPRAGGSAPER